MCVCLLQPVGLGLLTSCCAVHMYVYFDRTVVLDPSLCSVSHVLVKASYVSLRLAPQCLAFHFFTAVCTFFVSL